MSNMDWRVCCGAGGCCWWRGGCGGAESGSGSGIGLGGAVIGGEAGSGAAGLVACSEGRSAWIRSSLCCSISARVGGLGRVMPILRFRISGFLSAFATLTVASLGCKFPSKTSGSMAGRSARVPCMHASRPCVRVRSTRGGSLGAPVHSAWMHDGALPLRISSSVSELTYTDAICRRKFRVWLNKNETRVPLSPSGLSPRKVKLQQPPLQPVQRLKGLEHFHFYSAQGSPAKCGFS